MAEWHLICLEGSFFFYSNRSAAAPLHVRFLKSYLVPQVQIQLFKQNALHAVRCTLSLKGCTAQKSHSEDAMAGLA